MTEFTPMMSMFGGALVGLATVALMGTHGRIAGISGIIASLFGSPGPRDLGWRVAFVMGMIAAPTALLLITGDMPQITVSATPVMLVVGGFLIGVGVSFGSGCTSGHGVCGMARLSIRSIAATMTFMTTSLVTVFVVRHVIGA